VAISNKSGAWADLLTGRFFRARCARLYCVGTSKSGTHSLAEMFARGARTQHEAQAELVIQKTLGAAIGRISREELTRWVRARDLELALEVDSSQLNFFLLDILLAEFPDARFVLTIRDAYSWLDSLINHLLHYNQAGPEWTQLREFRFRPDVFTHAPEERLLKEKGLHALDGYLSYWATHNGQVVAQVPPAQLLVVRTEQIRERASEICNFAGLPRRALELDRTHAFKNPQKFNLVRQLDRGFLEQKIEKHCRPLMSCYFPEIKSFADSKL
jgi:hypothetical protein